MRHNFVALFYFILIICGVVNAKAQGGRLLFEGTEQGAFISFVGFYQPP